MNQNALRELDIGLEKQTKGQKLMQGRFKERRRKDNKEEQDQGVKKDKNILYFLRPNELTVEITFKKELVLK